MNTTNQLDQPRQELQRRIAQLLGVTPQNYRRVVGGYTPAARWVAQTDHGSCFIKVATTPLTATFLHREIQTYAALRTEFMPQLIAVEDHETEPLLILEDLSEYHWPPPWTEMHIETMLGCIHEMHTTPAAVDSFDEVHKIRTGGWAEVARDPEPFLRLGVVSISWLDHALPKLMEWESRCPTEGDALTHMDLRSDNMCLRGSRAILIDWNCACLSNPKLDLGFWLPSLTFEGGPLPERILPDAPEVAAWVAGFFASRAGLPDIPDALRVRLVQRQQLQTALPWAVRALDLPELLAPGNQQ